MVQGSLLMPLALLSECNLMCPSKLPQSCLRQKVMSAEYCGQPGRLAAPSSILRLSFLFFFAKVSQCESDLQPHPVGRRKDKGKGKEMKEHGKENGIKMKCMIEKRGKS